MTATSDGTRRITLAGELDLADNLDDYKGEPIAGGPTDPDAPS